MKINAIITGSTGMVGKGVLLECLDHPDVESVLVINRKPVGIEHDKLKEIIQNDFYDLTNIEDQLKGYNACFFCLGVSAFRMSEAGYTRITYDLTLNFAGTVLNLNPDMTFCYVSGLGTDGTEKGRTMWARVKGKTENDLLSMAFQSSYMFRPGYIQPMKGIRSSTKLYNTMYAIFKPLYPILKTLTPNGVTSTTQVGKAMINIIKVGYDNKILSNKDVNILAAK
ncbi:epimerase [Bacteroidota bacterium]